MYTLQLFNVNYNDIRCKCQYKNKNIALSNKMIYNAVEMDGDYMEFKDRLKQLRTEKGITATQLAFQIDKGESAVRMWEIGRSKPDADTLIRLSHFFNCSVDFLLGLAGHKTDIEQIKMLELLNEISHRDNGELINSNDFQVLLVGLLEKMHSLGSKNYTLAKLLEVFTAEKITADELDTLEIINVGLCSLDVFGKEKVLAYVSGLMDAQRSNTAQKEG